MEKIAWNHLLTRLGRQVEHAPDVVLLQQRRSSYSVGRHPRSYCGVALQRCRTVIT